MYAYLGEYGIFMGNTSRIQQKTVGISVHWLGNQVLLLTSWQRSLWPYMNFGRHPEETVQVVCKQTAW